MYNKFFPVILLLIISSFSIAQEKTFIREYAHRVGDADSKITSRAIALNQVKKILLEEIGVYIESTFEIEKTETDEKISELTKNQITNITAGITETKILDEKWNGIEFYIKAEITIDLSETKNKLAIIAKDRDKAKQLVEANNRADIALEELEKLRTELKKVNSEKETLHLQKEYGIISNILTSSDWFQKGYNAYELKEYDKAIEYLKKVIELDPNYEAAYYNLGNTYNKKGNYDKEIVYY
ncbi:MAG: tetratricopeptide repeat protein [Melioribacteraceae bacterium]|nr:tetratricopeptide repeat protein [Melioribacteraceae bacterium]